MGWLSPLSPAVVREERLASLAYGQAPHEIAAQLVARGETLFKGRGAKRTGHSMTSSASNWNESEILNPIDRAVLRLMTSSNLVGC